MAEADEDFKFRMSNWQLVRGLSGAASCSQSQIDEFWRFLSGEAREVSTDGGKQQQQPQQTQQLGKQVQAKVASLEAQIAMLKGAGKGGGQPLKPGPKAKAGAPHGGGQTKGKDKGKDSEQPKFCKSFESDAGCKQGVARA